MSPCLRVCWRVTMGQCLRTGRQGLGKASLCKGYRTLPLRGVSYQGHSSISLRLVHASYLEIYNEDVHDLLGEDIKKKLDLKEHPDKGVYVHSKLNI